MKTTINLPEETLLKLKAYYPNMTMTTIVAVALEQTLLQKKYESFQKLWGKVPIKGFNLTRLRDRKHLRPLRYAS
jgi:hypothetical protein